MAKQSLQRAFEENALVSRVVSVLVQAPSPRRPMVFSTWGASWYSLVAYVVSALVIRDSSVVSRMRATII